jgi:hypothetical protein
MKILSTFDKARIAQFSILLVAGLAVILLYSTSLDCGFVLDDKNNIEKNPYIQITSLSVDSLSETVTKSVLPRRPVANITFALNYLTHGYDVGGFRLVNIFLHLGTGILLYFLVYSIMELPNVRRKYGPPGWVPLVTALIWLLHPMHAQTVNYIVQRMTLLAAFFYILAFLFYIKGRTTESIGRKWIFYAGTAIAAFLGLGSKETVAMLPFLLVLFDLYFFRDKPALINKRFIAATLILMLIACLLAIIYLGKNPFIYIVNSYHIRDFTLEQRLLTQSRVVLFYLSLVFLPLPSRLNLEHDFLLSTSLFDPLSTLFAIGLIITLTIIAIAGAKRYSILSFCIFWFLGNLLIESSVIGLEIIFEHRVYLPSMLVIMLAVLWLQKVLHPKWFQVTALVAVASCLVFWTYERNTTWSDTVSLLNDSVEKSPAKHRAHLNLGIELKNSNRIDEAISHYQKALQLEPNYAEAYYNLGNALILKGDFKTATANYFKALALTPDDVDTHYNLGYTLAKLWQFDNAVYHYSEAIRLKPDFMEARKELAELKLHIQKLYNNKNPPK